jgi:hypothetical protein
MAKNDKVLIDGIIDERIELKTPSDKRDEVFEYFVFEQLTKDYDLSKEELTFGNIDGRNDGGIDGFFIFINGHLLTNTKKFVWPKSGAILEVWLITCKHHDTFKQAPLDNIVASISELFDFSIENKNLKGSYSEELIFQRGNFKYAYRKTSPRLSEFKLNFFYASRGNTEELGDSIISRAKQLEQFTKDFFGNSNTKFNFLGATELIELYRKVPNFSLELPFSESLSSDETYILLVKLKDYFNFITDSGKLRRYLFDSNIRDFMGLNRVNEDIRNTLFNNDSPDFWWLNNGVTVLATGASVVGKSIQIQDIQIVNGLQTSESIHRYFSTGGKDIKNRLLLVKVIVSNNNENRDEIIRATNNQTNVELSSLHATDKIQRDIEEVLKLNGFYYERRTNFYKNQGIHINKIITPLYIASGYASLVLKSPHLATNLKARFMDDEESYKKVFSIKTDLQVWPKIAYILTHTDKFLETKRSNESSSGERFLKKRRQYLSFLTISKILGDFNFSIYNLIQLDLSRLNNNEFEKSWLVIKDIISLDDSKAKLEKELFLNFCTELNKDGRIKGYESLEKKPENFFLEKQGASLGSSPKTFEFIEVVDALLPNQPWERGVHKEIAKKLGCTGREVYSAMNNLIKTERRFRQMDGILYDSNGNLINSTNLLK